MMKKIYKIECLTLTPGLSANNYRTPKGNSYLFQMGTATEISDKEDAEYFLNAGAGKLFREKGIIEDTANKIKDAVEGNKEPQFIEVEPGKEKPNTKFDWNENNLKPLNAKQQESLIKDLAGGGTLIPKLEKDKIKLILKLLGKDKKNEVE